MFSDVTLQVGALITMGCVLSVDPKVDEVIKAIEKDSVPSKISTSMSSSKVTFTNDTLKFDTEECDDFEEGYSDDEMFTAIENKTEYSKETDTMESLCFRSWILDICFKNLGWIFKGNEIVVRLIIKNLKLNELNMFELNWISNILNNVIIFQGLPLLHYFLSIGVLTI